MDPDQARQNVGPDLGSNSLQRLSTNNTGQRVQVGMVFGKVNSRGISIMAIYTEKKNQVPLFGFKTLYLLESSADNFCKQFGPRSGLTESWAWSGSKLVDTLIVFLKEFFELKVDFEKNQRTTKKSRECY